MISYFAECVINLEYLSHGYCELSALEGASLGKKALEKHLHWRSICTGEASALEGVSGSVKPDCISVEEALMEVRY